MTKESERLIVVEDVLDPAKSYAIYSRVKPDGYTRSWGLDIEPRDTLLERGRQAAEL